jgi:hypothetical protein
MLTQEQLHQVADHIGSQTLSETLVADIRRTFPGIHFTYCMDDDILNNESVFSGSGFNFYLVDGREHCLCLTNTLENATGIVIAEIISD